MQEDLNHKSVALSIKSTKITAKVLAKAMILAVRHMEKKKRMRSVSAKNAKSQNNSQKLYKGKQTLKQLSGTGNLQNLEITEQNIKFFEPVARKYNIDYALHKDDSENPPKWLVFFKAKDADMLTLAFKEFSAKVLKKQEKAKDAPLTFRELQRKYPKKIINQKKIKIREQGDR